jgi:hypothetical protein
MLVLAASPAQPNDKRPSEADSVARAFAMLNLLARPEVQHELDLVDAQKKKFSRIALERLMLLGEGPRSSQSDAERARARVEFNGKLMELEKGALDALLPEQRARMDQILLQEAARTFEPSVGLTNARLVDQLKITTPQVELIQTKAAEADRRLKQRLEELNKEIIRAKEAARSEVLRVLTAEQRRQYDELIGEPFEFAR